jgi:hypothetical protein
MFIFFARSFVIGKRFIVGSFKHLTVSTDENHFCNFKFERQFFFARSFVIGKRFKVGSFKYLTVSTVENHCNLSRQ